MTTKLDNTFKLTCEDIASIEYRVNSAYILDQPFDVPPEISVDSQGEWTITFKAGRHNTAAVAKSFTSVSGGSEDTMVAKSLGDKIPDALNFYFGLNVTVSLPNGDPLDNILIYLGQGFTGVNYNWWFGSINLINLSNGMAVLLGTQSGQIVWRATVVMSLTSCAITALSRLPPAPPEVPEV